MVVVGRGGCCGDSLFPSVCPSLCRRCVFRSVTWEFVSICVSVSNFICMLFWVRVVLGNHGPLTKCVYCGLCMRRECRERFPRHQPQRKPLVRDPGMHHGTCVTHVPWCMSGSVTYGHGKTFPAFQAHAQPTLHVSGKRPIVFGTS